ncbi:MAG TPA: DinB family protein [Phycisphaerae bacterium]|nr:DinB family protein [Phycisphaerae bacterium]
MASKIDFKLDEAIEVLSRTPAVLRAMLDGLPEHWTSNNYGPETFSPFDVVGHLIHADEVNWIERAEQILQTQDAEPFPPFDRYAMYEASRGKTLSQLLDEFERVRKQRLSDLASLEINDAQLELPGKHPAFDAVKLRELLATWVVHDMNHIHQVAKCLAHQYREAVGPWKEYLSILPK